MRIYTSYFYQLRFFPPYLVPISTARTDPAWYHDNRGEQHMFLDKNGVLNGLRAGMFAPEPSVSRFCSPVCSENGQREICSFKRAYEEQLQKINHNEIRKLLEYIETLAPQLGLPTNHPLEFAFVVHEAPTNYCSERSILQKFLRQIDIGVTEWSRSRN